MATSQLKFQSKSKRKARVVQVLERLREKNPTPRCELYFHTPFQLLVSVVLSAQTTDKSVNKCMEPLYDRPGGFDPEQVVAMGADALLTKIRTIGLAPTKSKNVVKLAAILIEKYGGQVPRSREELEALPGVGKKTASVVLAEVYGDPTLAVDTHVFRVTARLGLHNETTPDRCEGVLLDLIPKEFLPAAHHWFILLGRYTCVARGPHCESCAVAEFCPQIGVR